MADGGAPVPITATLPEFTRLSGLSKRTAYRLMRTGELQSIRILGRRLIVVDSYRDLVNRKLNGGKDGGTNR